MKENKKNVSNFDESKELNAISNDNVCEIIEMAINDIEDLYNHMNDMQLNDNNEEERDSLDDEFDKYFMPLFKNNSNQNKILIH